MAFLYARQEIRPFFFRTHSSGVRLHSHFAIEQPSHYSFQEFREIIYNTWVNTAWGNKVNTIEKIRNLEAYADYQVKDGPDSLVVGATNIKNSDTEKDIINR